MYKGGISLAKQCSKAVDTAVFFTAFFERLKRAFVSRTLSFWILLSLMLCDIKIHYLTMI